MNNQMKACLLPKMSVFNLRGRGLKKEKMARGRGWGGGNYSREAIILNIFVKGGRLFEEGD